MCLTSTKMLSATLDVRVNEPFAKVAARLLSVVFMPRGALRGGTLWCGLSLSTGDADWNACERLHNARRLGREPMSGHEKDGGLHASQLRAERRDIPMTHPTLKDLRVVGCDHGKSEAHWLHGDKHEVGWCPGTRSATRLDLRFALGDVVECGDCGGMGKQDSSCPTPDGPCGYQVSCPSCVNGLVVAPEAVERMFEYLRRVGWVIPMQAVEAGLRTALLGGD